MLFPIFYFTYTFHLKVLWDVVHTKPERMLWVLGVVLSPGLECCSSAVSQDTFLNKQKEKTPQICSAGKAPNAFVKAASTYYQSA